MAFFVKNCPIELISLVWTLIRSLNKFYSRDIVFFPKVVHWRCLFFLLFSHQLAILVMNQVGISIIRSCREPCCLLDSLARTSSENSNKIWTTDRHEDDFYKIWWINNKWQHVNYNRDLLHEYDTMKQNKNYLPDLIKLNFWLLTHVNFDYK